MIDGDIGFEMVFIEVEIVSIYKEQFVLNRELDFIMVTYIIRIFLFELLEGFIGLVLALLLLELLLSCFRWLRVITKILLKCIILML